MKVKTTAEAWQKANELFPTDYMKDDALSKRAGYPQYYSTSPEHSDDHINDLNVRLEVVIGGANARTSGSKRWKKLRRRRFT